MDEKEIKKAERHIYNASQEITIQNYNDLVRAMDFLKNIKQHRNKIMEYWKGAKETAKKTYTEIVTKEKEMLEVCDISENEIKKEILSYKLLMENRAKNLKEESEVFKSQEIQSLLEETQSGNLNDEELEEKVNELEMIKNLEPFNTKYFPAIKGLSFQKRWQAKILDGKLVPPYFQDIEIRPIKTSKLLEIRKANPNVKISGIEFYQQETVSIKTED